MTRPCSRETRRLPTAARTSALLGSFALLIAVTGPATAEVKLGYRVDDANYGQIGTYGIAVATDGDTRTVTTRADIKVTVLGITLYRQEAVRRERWVGGRLVEFSGVTTENGTTVEIKGRTEADHFVLTSPHGQVTAPAGIRPISPLSAASPPGPVFLPDSGRVTTVRTHGAQATTILVAGASQSATLYRIETADDREHYSVWMDANGTPIKFVIKDADGEDTFTLQP